MDLTTSATEPIPMSEDTEVVDEVIGDVVAGVVVTRKDTTTSTSSPVANANTTSPVLASTTHTTSTADNGQVNPYLRSAQHIAEHQPHTSPHTATATRPTTSTKDTVQFKDTESKTDDDVEKTLSQLFEKGGRHCDRYRIQHECLRHDYQIPSTYRRLCWAVLLGVEGLLNRSKSRSRSNSTNLLQLEVAATPEDLSNQRVVMADVQRTRQTMEIFHNSAAIKQSAVRILTYYCKRKGCMYRQGMNEVLAPFLLLAAQAEHLCDAQGNVVSNCVTDSAGDDAASESKLTTESTKDGHVGIRDEAGTFNMFYSFMSRQLPHAFRDGFFALQYVLKSLSLLLQYVTLTRQNFELLCLFVLLRVWVKLGGIYYKK